MNILYLSIVFLTITVFISNSDADGIRILRVIETFILHVTGYTMTELIVRYMIYQRNVTFDPETSVGTPLPFPTSLTTPSIEDATHYVHYAAAAYCEGHRLSDWTCKECKATGPSTQVVQVINNKTAGTQGFIALDSIKQEIIISFRGTHNLINIIDHGMIHEMIPSPLKDGAKIHKGFMKAIMSLYPILLPIVTKLVDKHPGWRIVVTGHSLGASMAFLTYYLLSHDIPTKINYAVFTYGEPRSGDKVLADIINTRNISYARVVNENDVNPHSAGPASEGYVHHGTEYWTHNGKTRICSNSVYEDPTCSNSLKQKEQLLDGHLNYFGVNIGFNCLDENPLGQLKTIFYYRRRVNK